MLLRADQMHIFTKQIVKPGINYPKAYQKHFKMLTKNNYAPVYSVAAIHSDTEYNKKGTVNLIEINRDKREWVFIHTQLICDNISKHDFKA